MSRNKKQVRQNFRDVVFKRDGQKCLFCSETENLDAHHIFPRRDMPNGGYVKENGASLCKDHHLLAEKCLEGELRDEKFMPEALYKIIGSSFEDAIEASERLKK